MPARHCENCLAVAKHLEGHPLVRVVNYPGLPSHPGYGLAKKYLPKGCGSILGLASRAAAARLRSSSNR